MSNQRQLSDELLLKITNNPTFTLLRHTNAQTEKDYSSIPKQGSIRTGIKIPGSFDGRKAWDGLLSPVMDQGKCGSCWAFASSSTLADRFNIQSRGMMKIELSPTKLILCDFKGDEFKIEHPETDYDELNKINVSNFTKSSCTGNTIYDAWRYLFTIGTVTLSCVPYTKNIGEGVIYTPLDKYNKDNRLPLCTDVSGPIGDMCSDVEVDAFTGEEFGTPGRLYRSKHFYSIPGVPKDGGSEYNIRHNIYLWGPVTTGMVVYSDFYLFDPKNEIYKWNGQDDPVGGHAIEIVGWGEENGDKYWIVKNSWGPSWGRNGYFYMERGNNSCKIEENVVVGLPDFFYPEDYDIDYHRDWAENKTSIEQRRRLAFDKTITGGGIDPETGYTRRILVTKPWIDKTKPIQISDLPDWSSFIAAIDSSVEGRKKLHKKLSKEYASKGNHDTLILVIFIVMVVFAVLVIRKI